MGVRRIAVFAVTGSVVALLAAFGATAGPRANATLTVTVTGPGVVTGPGINCGNGNNDCTETYTAGVGITLTATGSAFQGWGGACSGNATSCSFTINSDTTVSASFGAKLTVDVNGSGVVTGPGINCGSGNTDCTEVYAPNTNVTLNASGVGGGTFAGWGGACSGNAASCSLTMSTDKGVSASFTGSATATLTVTPTGPGRVVGPGIDCGLGNTDCSETYALNTVIAMTANPAVGATFTGWGGDCSGTQSGCTVTMNASKSVTAGFTTTPGQSTLTVTVTGPGLVTGPGINCGAGNTDCSETYTTGAVVTLTASAAGGAAFLGWAQTSPAITGFCGGGVPGAPPRTCTVTMNVSKAVTALFGTTPAPTPAGFVVTKIGDPIVAASATVKNVTVHFFTNRAASAVMTVSLNGSTVSTFQFSPHAGDVLVGPFVLTAPGTYVLTLTLTDAAGNARQLTWAVAGPGSIFRAAVAVRGPASVVRVNGGWVVRVRFTGTGAGAANARMTRAGRLVSSGTFTYRRGQVTVNLPTSQTGIHHVTVTARNTSGRTVQMSWTVLVR